MTMESPMEILRKATLSPKLLKSMPAEPRMKSGRFQFHVPTLRFLITKNKTKEHTAYLTKLTVTTSRFHWLAILNAGPVVPHNEDATTASKSPSKYNFSPPDTLYCTLFKIPCQGNTLNRNKAFRHVIYCFHCFH